MNRIQSLFEKTYVADPRAKSVSYGLTDVQAHPNSKYGSPRVIFQALDGIVCDMCLLPIARGALFTRGSKSTVNCRTCVPFENLTPKQRFKVDYRRLGINHLDPHAPIIAPKPVQEPLALKAEPMPDTQVKLRTDTLTERNPRPDEWHTCDLCHFFIARPGERPIRRGHCEFLKCDVIAEFACIKWWGE